MAVSRPQAQIGMSVVGLDGKHVGRVKQVREADFVLDRRLMRDLCVPWTVVRGIESGAVALSVSAEDVPYQGWPCTKLFGG